MLFRADKPTEIQNISKNSKDSNLSDANKASCNALFVRNINALRKSSY